MREFEFGFDYEGGTLTQIVNGAKEALARLIEYTTMSCFESAENAYIREVKR
jgi:hypothetical protein